MDGKVDLVTLIALVIAVVVILRLRSVLGKRSGDEAERYERYKAQEAARETDREAARASAAAASEKVVTLPRRDRSAVAPPHPGPVELDVNQEQRMTKFAGGNPAVAKGLIDIAKSDTSFDPDGFAKGARAAYEMIVMAFAEGNRKALKDLLSAEVYAGFDAAISDREQRKERVEQTFVGLTSAEVVEAHVRDGAAQLTVHFVSDLISVVKDASGAVVSGDDRRIKSVNDVWTFSRGLNASTPNWHLIATQPVGQPART
jgi:predicted lipid-binding transport protein (Tim44 family)